MVVWRYFDTDMAKTKDTVTKYACLAQFEAQLGLAISAKEKIST